MISLSRHTAKQHEAFQESDASLLNYFTQKLHKTWRTARKSGGKRGKTDAGANSLPLHCVRVEEYCHSNASLIHLPSTESSLLHLQLERLQLYTQLCANLCVWWMQNAPQPQPAAATPPSPQALFIFHPAALHLSLVLRIQPIKERESTLVEKRNL